MLAISRHVVEQLLDLFLRRLSLVALMSAVIGSHGCERNPGECINGVDGLGRGPNVYISNPTCSSIGADLQCRATQYSSGYCSTRASIDVTDLATWMSSDTAIATFNAPGTQPGYLKVLAPGLVVVSAQYGFRVDGVSATYARGVQPSAVALVPSASHMRHSAIVGAARPRRS